MVHDMRGGGFVDGIVGVELEGFIVDHILEDFLGGLEIVEAPVEGLLGAWLSLLVMQAFKVRMGEALLDRVAFMRVEDEHLSEKVKSNWVCFRIEGRPGLLVAFWE